MEIQGHRAGGFGELRKKVGYIPDGFGVYDQLTAWAAVNATTGQSELQVTPPPPPSLPAWPQVLTTVLVLSLVGFYYFRRYVTRRR